MPETEMIDARVEPGLKHEAEAVLAGMGLSVAEAITLFYKQVTLQRGITPRQQFSVSGGSGL